MLIDVHAHIGTFGETTYSPEHLEPYVRECGVRQVLVSNIDAACTDAGRDLDEPDANLATLHACAGNDALLPVYWVRFGQFDSQRPAFAGALATEPFVGALFAPALHDFAPDEDAVQPWVQILTRLSKPLFVLCDAVGPARPPRVYELAKRNPRLTVVMITNGSDALWYEALDCLRTSQREQDSRLMLATSDASAENIAHAVEGVGPARLLFGSRAAARGPEHAAHVRQTLEALRATLAPDALARICVNNAETLLEKARSAAFSP